VTLLDSGRAGQVAAICHEARDRAWNAYHAVATFSSESGACRRRTLLDHFGDVRLGTPEGRCCDVCDPGSIGLPDPGSLTPARRATARRGSARPIGGPAHQIDPADERLVVALREWRMRAAAGKPAYTVAHNRTLEAIAALRPGSLVDLAQVKGIGPTFLERHGAEVLALVDGHAAVPASR
jgi:ATP-dependent DNA helicase RecQ